MKSISTTMATTKECLQILQLYFDATSKFDIETVKSLFHDDIVLQAPYCPDILAAVAPKRMEGKAAADAMYDSLPKIATPLDFQDVIIMPLQAHGEFFATYRGNSKMQATGLPYNQNYISKFVLRDGKIILIVEYFDPILLLTAFGGSVKLSEK